MCQRCHTFAVALLLLLPAHIAAQSNDGEHSSRKLSKRAVLGHPDAEYYFANNDQKEGWLASSNYPYPHLSKALIDYVFLFRVAPADADKMHSVCLRFVRFDYAASPANYPPCTSASISFRFSELSVSATTRLSTVANLANRKYCEDAKFESQPSESSYATLANGDRLNSILPGNLFDAPICFMFVLNGTIAASGLQWRALTMQLNAKESTSAIAVNYGLLARYSMDSVALDAARRDKLMSTDFTRSTINCTQECAPSGNGFYDWKFSQTSFSCECVPQLCSFDCSASSTSAVCESSDSRMVQCGMGSKTSATFDAATYQSAVAASRQRAIAASANPRCVPFASMCDRIPDCADGTDERLSICAPSSYTYTPLACDFSGLFCNYQATVPPSGFDAEDHMGVSSNSKRRSLRVETSSSADRQAISVLKTHVLPSQYTRAVDNLICVNFYFKIKPSSQQRLSSDQPLRAVRYEPYLLVLSRTYQPNGPTVLFVASLLHSVFEGWQKATFELVLHNETSTPVDFMLVADMSAQVALHIDDIAEANGPCRMRETLDCTFEISSCGWSSDPANIFERVVVDINITDLVNPPSQAANESRGLPDPLFSRIWIDHSNLILLQTHASPFSLLQLSQIASNGTLMRARSRTSTTRNVTLRSIILPNEARYPACFTMWAICIVNPIEPNPSASSKANPNVTDGSAAPVSCGRFRFALENAVGEYKELAESEKELYQRFGPAAFSSRRGVAWQLLRVPVPTTFDIAAYRLIIQLAFAPNCSLSNADGAYNCTVGIDDVQLIRAQCNAIEVNPELVLPPAPIRMCRKRVPLNTTVGNLTAATNSSNATIWIDVDVLCDESSPTHSASTDSVHIGALIALAVLLFCVVVSAVFYFWRKYNAPDDDDDDDDQLDFGTATHPDGKDCDLDSEADDDVDVDVDPDAPNAGEAHDRAIESGPDSAQRHDPTTRPKHIESKSGMRKCGNESFDDGTNGCCSSTDDEYFYGMPTDGDPDASGGDKRRPGMQTKSKSKAPRNTKTSALASRSGESGGSKRKKDSMSSTDEKTSADRMLVPSPSGAAGANNRAPGNAARYSSNLNNPPARRTTPNAAGNTTAVRFSNSPVQASNSHPYSNGNRVEVQARPSVDDTTIPKEASAANGRKQVYTTLALVERNPPTTATRTQLAGVSNGSPHDRIWNANEATANDEYDLQNECTV